MNVKHIYIFLLETKILSPGVKRRITECMRINKHTYDPGSYPNHATYNFLKKYHNE